MAVNKTNKVGKPVILIAAFAVLSIAVFALSACKPKKYSVTFDANGGNEEYSAQSVAAGEKAENPGTPTRGGYDFDGWYTEIYGGELWDFDSNAVTGDVTLYARWWPAAAYYTVEFDANGGNEIYQEQIIAFGEKAESPGTPTRGGYDFDGWYTELDGGGLWEFGSNAVSGDITLYARWIEIYTVTFDVNGGQETYPKQKIKSGEKAESPGTPTRGGYDFDGWYTEVNGGGLWEFGSNAVSGDITLYARWSPIVYYTVTFDVNGGKGTYPEQVVASGEKAACPETPTKDGYTFADWYTVTSGGEPWNFETNAVTGDITLYARWVIDLSAATDGLRYEYIEEYDGYSVSMGDATANEIIIPDRYNGKSVAAIKELGFYDKINITAVYLPDSVTRIGESAFFNCVSLAFIELPDGITDIGDYAFIGCASLTSIRLPAGVTSIGEYTFAYCDSLISAELPDGLTDIGFSAFFDCFNLTLIELPDSLKSIGDYAFYECRSLTLIELPNGAAYIGYFAFYGCGALTIYAEPGGASDGWDADWNVKSGSGTDDEPYERHIPV
ncbi:MAG: InlB B-repeat-containing protein [Clostridiales bacterium]|jgi:uncharacterized repeat protein (TIGR02543 family)|nr:InlB B-repeat-containing protein [Clostridiales bacterium]